MCNKVFFLDSLITQCDMLYNRYNTYDDEKTYDIKELASISKLSKWTIYEKISKRVIPFHKTARGKGKLYFLGRELNEWDRFNSDIPNHPIRHDDKHGCSLIRAKKSTLKEFESFLKKKVS